MNKYQVHVCLEGDYVVEAENEEEAFVQASDDAMSGGDWQWDVELIEEDVDEY